MSMPRALVISPGAFKFSTRARKAALTLATKLDTTFLGLSKVGRTKMWDVPGEWIESGVRVVQVKVSTPHTEPTSVNQALNILTVYVPALIRMLARAVRTPANVIYVNGTSLLIIGLVHRTIFRVNTRFRHFRKTRIGKRARICRLAVRAGRSTSSAATRDGH